jgi:lipopolysaccharide export system permease protein
VKLLDRYILGRFFQYFLFALFASVIIFVTVDSTEMLDKFIDAKAKYTVVLLYYYYYLPYILYLTLPVSVLLATLFSVGGFVYRNELTAMQSAGYSLWRIMGMLLLIAVPLSAGMLIFGESIVPQANRARKDLYIREVKRSINPASSRQGRLYMQLGPHDFLRMESYDPISKSGDRASLHTFMGDRLARRITAERILYVKNIWVFENADIREFTGKTPMIAHADTLMRADLSITPDDLARVNIEPEEMNYFDLRDLVTRLQNSGVRAGKWVVDLAFKLSQPFATVIIVLFGVPFAAFRRRGGLVLGFGLSLLVCFVYFGFMQVGKILGYNGSVEPYAAAWAGNIVFGLLGFYLIIRVPK